MFGFDDKKDTKAWKGKLINYAQYRTPAVTPPHGVSMAMDSRLEHGIELGAELRLKVSISRFV